MHQIYFLSSQGKEKFLGFCLDLQCFITSPHPSIHSLWNSEYQKGFKKLFIDSFSTLKLYCRFPDGVKLAVSCEVIVNVTVIAISFLYRQPNIHGILVLV